MRQNKAQKRRLARQRQAKEAEIAKLKAQLEALTGQPVTLTTNAAAPAGRAWKLGDSDSDLVTWLSARLEARWIFWISYCRASERVDSHVTVFLASVAVADTSSGS